MNAKRTKAAPKARAASVATPRKVKGAKPAARPVKGVRLARGYEAVESDYDKMRRAATIETKGEDGQLNAYKRLKLTALLRDMMRNSPAFVMQNRQLCVNVVGSVGGKMHAAFPEEYADAAREVQDWFNKVWAPEAEFTYGKNFNWILKTILTTRDICGNVVLVFDDGILSGGSGTGKLRAFEGDEIADVEPFSGYFPKGYEQSQGLVYDNLGRFAGAFVSTSQRGRAQFSASDGVIVLRRQTGNWIALGDMFRFNQGRAVSPLASALVSIIDLHETVSNEALAAKFNAKLVGQILHTSADDDANADLSPFDDEQTNDTNAPKVADMTSLRANGIAYQDMPDGLKMELFDTKRPNQNMPDFFDFLAGLIGGSRGLARVYSTLKAQTSYTAFRGEQIMTWQSFRDMQKELERDVCDWVARCAISRAVRLGLIRSALPDGWQRMIRWVWPQMVEVSALDAARALEQELRNGTKTLHDVLEPGTYEAVQARRAQEAKDCREMGLIYPPSMTVSGQVMENDGTEPPTNQKDDE